MIIVIEGCDGTSKTTLAHKLALELNLKYTKENKPLYDGFNYYLDRSLDTNLDSNILDRFHLGEYVYPQIKLQENRKPLTFEQIHLIENVLLSKGTILILADTSKDFILNTFRTRGEEYVFENEVDQIVQLFNEVYDKSILPKIKYDVTDPTSYEQILKFIKNNNIDEKF